MNVINSKEIIEKKKEELKERVRNIVSLSNYIPTLSIIQVEGDQASNSYVKNKKKIGKEVGIHVEHYLLPNDSTKETLLHLIGELNNDDHVDGIIVQLPLPKGLDEREILDSICPYKDVDGLSTYQIGWLQTEQDKAFIPCTALGVVELLKSTINIESKDIVIVNRSHLIGKPLQVLLTDMNATVTLCHSKTKCLRDKIYNADIVITGIGKANYLTKSYFRNGQVIIDCSMNRDEFGKLVGDVYKETLSDLDIQIASGPGHTGPFTVLALFINTLLAHERKHK